jgi:hypothetical protein
MAELEASQSIAIQNVREAVKHVTEGKPHLLLFCDDACVLRFLKARRMDVQKTTAMLEQALKWCELAIEGSCSFIMIDSFLHCDARVYFQLSLICSAIGFFV